MFSGKSYIIQPNGQGYELNVDPPTNPGTFTGTATVTFNTLIVGSITLTVPIEGGFWIPDHDHTAWTLDWGRAEHPLASWYPHSKRVRYNGFLTRVLTAPGTSTGDMWSGVMVDLDNKGAQSTWIADGPFPD